MRWRDQLLFRLFFEIGLRVGEALALYVEDLDLIFDEHLHVLGKGDQSRWILLDNSRLVKQLRTHLRRSVY
jgi:integrase/recombinase XerD